ncbi:MAG TPA: hypothetical protein VF595_06455 [Tepidisphaeraceae bacterium]|jgi:uncharacterized delta-60 repeat protein
MIERLSSRIHFAVFGPDLSYDDGLPAETDGAFLKVPVSGGKLLAAYSIPLPLEGYYDEQQEYTTRFARYLPDGTRDRTFGKNGRLDVGQTAQVRFVPGEGILVVPEDQPVIRSYTLNGRVDADYDKDGRIDVPLSRKIGGNVLFDSSRIVHAQADGKVLVLSQIFISGYPSDTPTQRRYELVRLNTDGSLDPTFGQNGYVAFRQDRGDVNVIVTPRDLYVHADYLYSTRPPSGAIVQYTLNGKTADGTFGGDNRVAIPGFVEAITEQPDGKLLFIDTTYGQDPVLYRLKTDGTPDTTFSGDGKLTLSYNDTAGSDVANSQGVSLRLDAQNRIVVSAEGSIFRFNPDGTPSGYPFNGTAPFPTRIASVDAAGNVIGTDGRRYGLVTPQQIDAKGVVQITTDSRDDTIRVADAGNGKIRVIVNGESRLFRAADVRALNLQTYDGDLNLRVSVDVPVTLKGGDGDVTIVASDGDDDITLGAGDTRIDLGGGNDTLKVGADQTPDPAERHTLVGSSGNKVVSFGDGQATIDLAAGDHQVNTGSYSHDTTITIAGGNNDVRLSGKNERLTIGGRGRNDVTSFGENATVTTGTGRDTILAISPYGTFNTGGGDDTVTVRNFGDNPTRGVTVYAGSGDDHVFCDDGYQSLATVYGGAGDDRLEGNTQSQRLYGENGNDTLSGGDGIDTLFGGDMDDLLIGGASGDRLYGDAGDDRLYGEGGPDKLYGGDGDDRFFTKSGSTDTLFGDAGDDRAEADAEDVLNDVVRG